MCVRGPLRRFARNMERQTKGGASAAPCICSSWSDHWTLLDLAEVFELVNLSLGAGAADALSALVKRTLPLIPLISIAGPPLPMRAE